MSVLSGASQEVFMRRIAWELGGYALCGAVIVAAAHQAVVAPAFRPIKVAVDLSHADQQTALEGPWITRPDHRFPGVMSAFDQGQPVHVKVSVPAGWGYESRLKMKFYQIDQVIDVFWGQTRLMTIRPSRIGEAEKFNVRVPRHVVRCGVVCHLRQPGDGRRYRI